MKALCARREAVGLNQITSFASLTDTFRVSIPPNFPTTRNPIYATILARHVSEKTGAQILAEGETIRRLLIDSGGIETEHHPDSLVLGDALVAFPTIPKSGESLPEFSSPFITPNLSRLTAFVTPGAAFGISICLLLSALDWIQLGRMPWAEILFDALNPKGQT